MAIVIFDADAFRNAYPQFAAADGKPFLTDGQLGQAFDVACLMLDNTDQSPVPYNPDKGVMIRRTLLWLIVCHLAAMALWPSGQAGPMTNAAEGSVSVSFSAPPSQGKAYWNQTPCGQAFWQAVQRYVAGGRYYAVKHYHPWG